MRTRPTPNCQGCTERFVGCHSQCEDYKRFKAEVEMYKEDVQRLKQTTGAFADYTADKIKNNMKKRGVKYGER